MTLWFLKAAKAIADWAKQNWYWIKWVLLPLGVILFILEAVSKRSITVLDTPLVDADKKKAELDQQAQQAKEEAAKERDAEIKKANQAADSNMAVVVDAQKKAAPGLQADEDALNKELLEIGQQQRKS
jgi:hypothetical protein